MKFDSLSQWSFFDTIWYDDEVIFKRHASIIINRPSPPGKFAGEAYFSKLQHCKYEINVEWDGKSSLFVIVINFFLVQSVSPFMFF